jgi:hypothetical protein
MASLVVRLMDDDSVLALADSRVSMTAYLILERAFCSCFDDGLCTCEWDD